MLVMECGGDGVGSGGVGNVPHNSFDNDFLTVGKMFCFLCFFVLFYFSPFSLMLLRKFRSYQT